MMISEIEQYKLKLRYYLNALGGAASFGFSILQFLRGDPITGSISAMGGIYFSVVLYFLITKRHYLWKGRGFVLFIPITILNVIHVHPDFGIYWAYVGVLSFFLALELEDACIGVTLFVLITFYLASLHYPGPVFIRICATLLLVSLFSFLLSYFIEQLLTKVNSLVIHDSLTNTLNRHTFHSSMENALKSFTRYKTKVSLFIFDLDFFKRINDKHGHQIGDDVLIKVSQVIQQRLRDSDLLFRYGGEEFAILLIHTNQQEALLLAQEIRALVEAQDYNIGQTVTISGGVSEAQPTDVVSSWIERCDKALYEAKESGRNNIMQKS
jgi:diguanylate cyclase (GGDEF)-like protein